MPCTFLTHVPSQNFILFQTADEQIILKACNCSMKGANKMIKNENARTVAVVRERERERERERAMFR